MEATTFEAMKSSTLPDAKYPRVTSIVHHVDRYPVVTLRAAHGGSGILGSEKDTVRVRPSKLAYTMTNWTVGPSQSITKTRKTTRTDEIHNYLFVGIGRVRP